MQVMSIPLWLNWSFRCDTSWSTGTAAYSTVLRLSSVPAYRGDPNGAGRAGARAQRETECEVVHDQPEHDTEPEAHQHAHRESVAGCLVAGFLFAFITLRAAGFRPNPDPVFAPQHGSLPATGSVR